MTVDAVIFDIGNVLIEWQPERHYDATVGVERRKTMFETVDLHAMNDLVDQGYDFRATIEVAAAQHPEFKSEIMMWYYDWIRMAQPAIPHSVKLLRALRKKGVPVFALTNFGIESFEFAETQYPFLTEFDRRYVSGRMGCVKPHSIIYEMVEADCKIPPQNLLFTDDRQDNIDTAQARGWQTHLFDGPLGWAGRLVEEGLLTPREASA
ncbi:HAD family hydrolase [Celeribacter ethanolicus]|uniref:HAD family phosphatase n=1 Tax=Celeribacter ethanolicus TaxID=1758178 RepID=A0A291GEP2_9RHOB|nr:HAD family phosphatase [Celeribacter ethanolicus]ATG48637.1 HAD family phosphatase [Celeribacter ethanolicus]TNE68136.1 MAG: HAD family phosphatase [Paracoccaceae bacterium]